MADDIRGFFNSMSEKMPRGKSADAKAKERATKEMQDESSKRVPDYDAAVAPSTPLAASGPGQDNNSAIVSLTGLEPVPESIGRGKYVVSRDQIQNIVAAKTEAVQSKLKVTEVQ